MVLIEPLGVITCINVCTHLNNYSPKHWQTHHCLNTLKNEHTGKGRAAAAAAIALPRQRNLKFPQGINEILKHTPHIHIHACTHTHTHTRTHTHKHTHKTGKVGQ